MCIRDRCNTPSTDATRTGSSADAASSSPDCNAAPSASRSADSLTLLQPPRARGMHKGPESSCRSHHSTAHRPTSAGLFPPSTRVFCPFDSNWRDPPRRSCNFRFAVCLSTRLPILHQGVCPRVWFALNPLRLLFPPLRSSRRRLRDLHSGCIGAEKSSKASGPAAHTDARSRRAACA